MTIHKAKTIIEDILIENKVDFYRDVEINTEGESVYKFAIEPNTIGIAGIDNDKFKGFLLNQGRYNGSQQEGLFESIGEDILPLWIPVYTPQDFAKHFVECWKKVDSEIK